MGLNIKNIYKSGSKKTGSAILIVVLIMAVLSICCLTFWQKSMLFYDISLKRLEYEQKYRVTTCSLEHAISMCSKNFDVIIAGQKPSNQDFGASGNRFDFSQDISGKYDRSGNNSHKSLDIFEIETEEFKFTENIKYKCKICIKKDGDKSLSLKSVLFDALEQKAFEVSCNLLELETVDLSKKIIKNFFIKNWKVCDK